MSDASLILVIDDDLVFADVLVKALTKRGYNACSANSLAEAEQQAKIKAPDYAVLDLKLHQETGLDAIPGLLAINPQMRILILTGYSSIATAVTAIKLGAIDYACKPLDADAILLKLGLKDQPPSESHVIPQQPLSVDRLQWEYIQRVLTDNNDNISATARSLGMHRRTLQRKLQKRPVKK